MLKMVRHHNLIEREINESLELHPDKPENREIYCRKLHKIVVPQRTDCMSCPYLTGVEQGNGIECTWLDECEDDHVVYYEDRFKEFERVDRLIKKKAEKETCLSSEPVSVYFAMSEEQAEKEGVPVCLQPSLPKAKEVYFNMELIPAGLCEETSMGWERTIKVKKKNVDSVLKILYPDGCRLDLEQYFSAVDGDVIRIIGFGD